MIYQTCQKKDSCHDLIPNRHIKLWIEEISEINASVKITFEGIQGPLPGFLDEDKFKP